MNKSRIQNLICILILLTGIIFCVVINSQKQGYHIDEIYTMGLSNRSLNEGESYDTLETNKILEYQYFETLLTATDDTRFNLKNVYNTLGTDNHPPFYFYLYNLLSSVNPKHVSKIFGMVINLVFYIISFILAQKIISIIFRNEAYLKIIMGFTFLLPAFITELSFYRMYCMLQCMFLLLTWWLIKYYTITTLIISKKPGNTGISRDIRTEFTTDLLLSD